MKTENQIKKRQKKTKKRNKLKQQAIPRFSKKITVLTTEQMIEVDKLMIEEYKIELIQMMENAGRNLAILAKKRFLKKKKDQLVVVLAGTGGNGGGALVCARRLHAWGYKVVVFVTDTNIMTPIPRHQLDILRRMKVNIHSLDKLSEIKNPGLIIDGIIGYSLSGSPFGKAKEMINWSNAQDAPILALDTPSGIDLTTGSIYEPAIRAQATLTLALPKVGLYADDVKPLRGELYLGDISVPSSLYAEPSLSLKVKNIFKKGDLVRLD